MAGVAEEPNGRSQRFKLPFTVCLNNKKSNGVRFLFSECHASGMYAKRAKQATREDIGANVC
jgi:hypothetical protein